MATIDPTSAEDAVAREMIERIARQVDLESGRMPRADAEPDPEADRSDEDMPAAPLAQVVLEPEERSEEDVSRELVERIAREVDEGRRG